MTNATTDVTLELSDGGAVHAALAQPEAVHAPALIIIHEWWGLNDETRTIATRMASKGYLALAVDLFDGQVTTEPGRALELMNLLDADKAKETLMAWIKWLRQARRGNGKVGTLGFCLGGEWSLNASLAAPVDATVIYYGNVKKTSAELASLNGPVLAHFGWRDPMITVDMAEGFQTALKAAHKQGEIHFYDANHAFSRPGGPNFDSGCANLAEERTLAFLQNNLR